MKMKKYNRVIALIVLQCFMINTFALPGTIPPPPALPEREVYGKTVLPDEENLLEYGGVVLKIPAGAVEQQVEITIEKLNYVSPLPGSMKNFTEGSQGFRFGPHGMKFKKNIEIALPYSGVTGEAALSNLFTYFYNDEAKQWERLPRVRVDEENHQVISLTNHFTDMVNTTLQIPELPGGVDFDLNSIKELKAAAPGAGIPGLEGLSANNRGTASFGIPFRLPPGRGGASPSLALSYNSEGGSGWLGQGFDINIPRITRDTRFGVPTYTSADTFLLNGQKLVLFEEGAGRQVFRLKREGSFQQIVRLTGNGEDRWEITAKDGSRQIYGTGEGWIGAQRNQVFT